MKKWRLITIFCVMFILAAAIISRLFYLQIVNHKFYLAQALGQQAGFKEVQGMRGEIFFENSKESRGASSSGLPKSLAINEDKWLIAALPPKIKDKGAFTLAIGKAIGQPASLLEASLQTENSYVILKKDLPDQEVASLETLKIEGVSLENTPGRDYPQERMAGQVIGVLGGNGTGPVGI